MTTNLFLNMALVFCSRPKLPLPVKTFVLLRQLISEYRVQNPVSRNKNNYNTTYILVFFILININITISILYMLYIYTMYLPCNI